MMLTRWMSSAESTPESSYLETLNSEQREAVEHGIGAGEQAGPLLIIAGAGTGKTATLAHRVVRLIEAGADPFRILLLTFSRRAADEMKRRAECIAVRALGEGAAASLAWAGTFHAIGARLLREHADQLGLDLSFSILDREDSADLMGVIRHDLGLSSTKERFPTARTCLEIYSRVVNAQLPLAEVLKDTFPWCASWGNELRRLFAGYVEAKQAQMVLDYDDLLLHWAQAMEDPDLAAEIRDRFDYVLVDEYQDTNRLQATILTGLKPDGRGLTVVGDDAQAIYSFRASCVRNILDFPTLFSPPATVLTLARNYRSTKPILMAANAVIDLAPERFTKQLWSERASEQKPRLVTVRDEIEQARYVADRVLEDREAGVPLKQQAILFRTSSHSGHLEVELTRRAIPYVKFGGLKFLDSAHVKDVLAVLRWAENPRDRLAGFRVLQLLPGVGPAHSRRVLDEMAAALMPIAALAGAKPPAAAAAAWPDLTALMRALRDRDLPWPAELDAIQHWYGPHLERIHEDAEIRSADLVQLAQIATGSLSRSDFLTDLTLGPPEATGDYAGPPLLDDDYLNLSTIHSAKGREFRSVHVINVVDGCIPSDLCTGSTAEIEEERRLLHVAMTRAKDELHLVMPHRFYTHAQMKRGDRHIHAPRTRFIPNAIVGLFERSAWSSATATAGSSTSAAQTRVDVGAKARAMWN
ncbi:DNA helicase-2/ATP-dependent DNA helicase PcrA [Inquilinus ginsengisoli]|uniref:DNA 3'-5' helicase n=1 Tax=Inquilinus ginsengisoli TaxID=363840 RepID=A0ABU1K0B5_9PROT|nr:ATP-dependent helicase [Inquilinus ginsengisoli]MDR6294309.1 DNA helicase-2/ATP-dependent DNA helicase PcrA [Inquilinus ginsengisoli]